MARNQKLTTSRNKPYAEVAQGEDGWHFQVWAGNGQPVCRSAVPYANEKQAINAVRSARATFAGVEIVVKASA